MYDEGGIYVENSAFRDNRAGEGGAIMIYEEAALTVDQSTFSGNTATTDGGAIYLYDETTAEIRNSTFSNNHADNAGGAFYITDDSVADIQFSTIVSNSAYSSGGGIFTDEQIAVQSSIIAGNNVSNSLASPVADCSISTTLRSGKSNLLGESGGCMATRYDETLNHTDLFNTVLAPLADNGGPLLPDGSHPQTFALLANSPAVDAAFSIFCLDHDQTGAARPQGNRCDIGAVESVYSASVASLADHIITVDTTADEMNTNGACSLREAIVAANTDKAVDSCAAGDGWDTISLPAGTFTLTRAESITTYIDLDNLTGDLDITSTITIIGIDAAETVIDGNHTSRVFDIEHGALHLTDVTVQNGDTTIGLLTRSAEGSNALSVAPPGIERHGGCIRSKYGLITIEKTVITRCTTGRYGAGIYSQEGTMHIVDTLITDNSSLDENGGAYNYYGVATIQNSRIISNTARSYGGGVMTYVGATRISSSQIFSNTIDGSSDGGGGINLDYGVLVVEKGTEVRYNHSNNDAGGIYGDYGAILIKDSMITNNSAKDEGGGIYIYEAGGWVQNSLITDNSTQQEGGGYHGGGYLQNNIIRDNEAYSSTITVTTSGGGIYGWGILENNLIQNNRAKEGAGIHSQGTMLFNTHVLSNSSQASHGAGLYLYGNGGTYLFDSTIQGNVGFQGKDGAGIYASNSDSTIVSRNSTIAGNRTAASGGGIYSVSVVDLLNSTISSNESDLGAGIWISGSLIADFSTISANRAMTTGGGIVNHRAASIMNSIVAGNTAANDADCSANAPFTFIGNSLFGDGAGCAGQGRSDLKVDASMIFTTVLKSLADYGGTTATHALQKDSPAINSANNDHCPTTDQRHTPRPQDGGCDIGAFEKELFLRFLPSIRSN